MYKKKGISNDNELAQPEPNEHCCEKTVLRGFRRGPTQARLYNHTTWLEAGNFVCRK